tara:strand:- start:48 stop:308 length:261 start_codon:yes stop_codon:yes gene_type:complete
MSDIRKTGFNPYKDDPTPSESLASMIEEKSKLKEFRLTRTSIKKEEVFVMATDWEDAEYQGHMNCELDWEYLNEEDDIEVEDCEDE